MDSRRPRPTWLAGLAGGLALASLGARADELRFTSQPDMVASSWAFAQGGPFPSLFTCYGGPRSTDGGAQGVVSPPFRWENVPRETKSLAVVMEEPGGHRDKVPVKGEVFYILYNLPPEERGLLEGKPFDELHAKNVLEGVNSEGKTGFRAPCPKSGVHHYVLRVYALDIMLPDLGKPNKRKLERAMRGHVLDLAETDAYYKRAD